MHHQILYVVKWHLKLCFLGLVTLAKNVSFLLSYQTNAYFSYLRPVAVLNLSLLLAITAGKIFRLDS